MTQTKEPPRFLGQFIYLSSRKRASSREYRERAGTDCDAQATAIMDHAAVQARLCTRSVAYPLRACGTSK